MSAKLFFIQFAKDIKECFGDACMCCTERMAQESQIIPRTICDEENQLTDNITNSPKNRTDNNHNHNHMEVIVEDIDDGYDTITIDIGDDEVVMDEVVMDEVVVETICSRTNKIPENKSPVRNDFVVIYHTELADE